MDYRPPCRPDYLREVAPPDYEPPLPEPEHGGNPVATMFFIGVFVLLGYWLVYLFFFR